MGAEGAGTELPDSLLYPYSHLKDVSVNKPQNCGGKCGIATDTKMSLVLHTEPIALFVIRKTEPKPQLVFDTVAKVEYLAH